MRIGIDVGGTHTDAVLFDDTALIATVKKLTTDDITSGVVSAVKAILADSGVMGDRVQMLTLGTTQFTNAVVQRRDLASVGAIRIGAQSSSALAIGAKWPIDIAAMALGQTIMVNGGHEYDGAPIIPLDETGLRTAIAQFKKTGIKNIAISSIFATSNPKTELLARAIVREQIPDAYVSMSHELGRIGIYQRENATLLNASLLSLSNKVITAFERAFADLSLSCPLFISQNDGTLMTAKLARQYPVMTFSSGPTNSMRGAAWLTGHHDAMVVDVGGTTSDVGMLINSFPRPSGASVKIGGVLTNFRMPDVLAVGIGGGSIVSDDGNKVGPLSVGSHLPRDGLSFGGKVLTASDIGIAAGDVDFGDPSLVHHIGPDTVSSAKQFIRSVITQTVDKMKTSADPLPLIVVGGGGFLIPDTIDGVSDVLRPENAGVANAIGAAFAQISGESELLHMAASRPRQEAIDEAIGVATHKAIEAGALASTITIADVHENPITYTDEPGSLLHVRVIGDADLARFQHDGARS